MHTDALHAADTACGICALHSSIFKSDLENLRNRKLDMAYSKVDTWFLCWSVLKRKFDNNIIAWMISLADWSRGWLVVDGHVMQDETIEVSKSRNVGSLSNNFQTLARIRGGGGGGSMFLTETLKTWIG